MRVCVFCAVVMLIGCTQEDPSWTLEEEVGHYQTGEQALRGEDAGRGRGRRSDGFQVNETWTEDGEISSPEIVGEDAEAIIETFGLVPARSVNPGDQCSTVASEHRQDPPIPQPAEPYVPSLWSEVQSSSPPGIIHSLVVREPSGPPDEATILALENVELSEMGRLLEAYRADGCADDTLNHVPRCANHPYRVALEARQNDPNPPDVLFLVSSP